MATNILVHHLTRTTFKLIDCVNLKISSVLHIILYPGLVCK